MKSFIKGVFASAMGVLLGGLVLLFAIPIMAMLIFKGFQHSAAEPIKKNSILHLRLRGELVDKHRPLDFDFMGGRSILSEDQTFGLYELNKAIDLAKDDNRITGIYLDVRGLRAGYAGLTALRRHIEEFEKSGKWVYAYADQYDEHAYFLATSATKIFIEPNGDVEFKGLAVNEPFLKGLLDKLEIEPRVFRVGKFKAAIEPLIRSDMSVENRIQNQALLDDVWKTVRTAVMATSKKDEKQIDAIASNLEVSSAADALKAGFVSETLFQDQLEDIMKEKTVGKDNDLELVNANQVLRDHKPKPYRVGKGKKIAVIFAEGEIGGGEGGRGSIGSESLREDILEAKNDDDVAAIVLRINSPGGDALASDVLWRELRVTDDELPVVVSMGDVAASGGYYMASAARYIFAEPTTITGSIGVFGLMFGSEKFFKNKAGVTFDRVVTHPHADLGDGNRAMTTFEGQVIQGEVERVYKRFIDVVQEGRGYENRADLESIAEGRVWSGLRAKELGLVDELGGLDQAIAKAGDYAGLGTDYDVEIFPTEADSFKHLIERLTGDVEVKMLGPDLAELSTLAKKVQNIKSGIYARLPFDMDFGSTSGLSPARSSR